MEININGKTYSAPDMEYYIGADNASGVKCDSFSDFVLYLLEEATRRAAENEDCFEVTVS